MPEFLGSQGSESIPKEKLPLSWKLPVWPHPWHLCNTHCCPPSGQKRGMPICHRSSWGLGGHEAGALHSRPASRLCDPGQEGTGNTEGALEMSVHLSPTLLLREMQPRPPVSATSRKSRARSRGEKRHEGLTKLKGQDKHNGIFFFPTLWLSESGIHTEVMREKNGRGEQGGGAM